MRFEPALRQRVRVKEAHADLMMIGAGPGARRDVEHAREAPTEARGMHAAPEIELADRRGIEDAEQALKILEVKWLEERYAVEVHAQLVRPAAAHVGARGKPIGSGAGQETRHPERVLVETG